MELDAAGEILSTLPVGASVRLFGLSKAALNGKIGKVGALTILQ
jgi:hypothetical protein